MSGDYFWITIDALYAVVEDCSSDAMQDLADKLIALNCQARNVKREQIKLIAAEFARLETILKEHFDMAV